MSSSMGVWMTSASGVGARKSSGISMSMVRTGGGLGSSMIGRGVRCSLSIALFLLSDVARSSSICVGRFVGDVVLSSKVLRCLKAWYGSVTTRYLEQLRRARCLIAKSYYDLECL